MSEAMGIPNDATASGVHRVAFLAAVLFASSLLSACGGGGDGGAGTAASAPPSSSGSTTTPPATTSPPATTPPATSPAPSVGSASLGWSAPTLNDDGTALTDLAGFHVYSGTDPAALQLSKTINDPQATSTELGNLVAGATHYFAVSAFSVGNVESVRSDIGSKRIP